MVEMKANTFLETEKIGSLMRRYAMPCIISLLVGALYNIVDQIFIANADYLGSYGNAANSVVFPMTVIALAIATMIGDGCCAFVSISLGAGENVRAQRGVGNALSMTVLSSLVLAAVYLIFDDAVLTAFGANVNRETYELSKEYFFWISLGIPFYMFGQALNPIIRSDGSPKFAMVSLMSGAVCNCILDPIFIFIFRWGMMGAAVATVIGQIVSALLALVYLFRMKAIKLDRKSFLPKGNVIGKIIPLGITSFLSQVSIVVVMAAVLNVCRKYGALDPIFGQEEYAQIPTAVIGIVMKFFQLVIAVSVGLAAGCIPIVGYNTGAGRNDRTRELMKKLLIVEAAVGLAATAVFELFPKPLINIFGAANESAYYTDFAIRCIRLFLCTTTLACVDKGFCIFLQSLGRPWSSTALSLLREVVLGVGFTLILPIWLGLGGVLYFMAASDIITFIVTAIFIVKIYAILLK